MNDIGESSKQFLRRATLALLADAGKDALEGAKLLVSALSMLLIAPLSPLALVYWLFIDRHSNCLLWAVGQKLKSWRVVDIIRVKNSRGRTHWQVKVRQTGDVYEWYAKGASQRGRLANLWYAGEIKLVKRGKA